MPQITWVIRDVKKEEVVQVATKTLKDKAKASKFQIKFLNSKLWLKCQSCSFYIIYVDETDTELMLSLVENSYMHNNSQVLYLYLCACCML